MVDAEYNIILGYWHMASWALIFSACAVLIYGIYKRRSNRFACRKCGYDLRSVVPSGCQEGIWVSQTCPECGPIAPKHSFRYLLSRRVLVCALLLFLLSQLICMIPRARRSGPIAFIPTWVLSISTPLPRPERRFPAVPESFISVPTWYKPLYIELATRLIHVDHNWLHIKIIEWRNSTSLFGDNNTDRVLKAYRLPKSPIRPRYSSHIELALASSDLNRACLVHMGQPIYNYDEGYEAAVLRTRNYELFFSTEESHSLINDILKVSSTPLDGNLTWYAATDDVPEEARLYETLKLSDLTLTPESITTFAGFAMLIKASHGLDIKWDTSYASEPRISADIFNFQVGPSLASATLSQVLNYLTHTANCYKHPIHWQVQKSSIVLCPNTPIHSIAIAYDLRVSALHKNHKVRPNHFNPEYSMVYLLEQRISESSWDVPEKFNFYAREIDQRTVILAPIHIHARIQRLLPILRAELTLAEQRQTR